MILVIDNYDSFTFNLVQYFKELGEEVCVYRNDSIDCKTIQKLDPDRIVISPGPGTPEDAGISLELVKTFKGKIPILGVCLGHQVIAQSFGARIKKADTIIHGKTSTLFHNNAGLFSGIEDGFEVTRYHSLIIDESSLPENLIVDAWTNDGKNRVVMSVIARQLLVFGIQFHPEAILTQHGHSLLKNFLK